MIDPCPRIVLWRRVVHLFHEYKHQNFVGPFKKAGFDEYKVEPYFLDEDGNIGEPDIVATSVQSWICVEITMWNGSKENQLVDYQKLKSNYLASCGLRQLASQPDVMGARCDPYNDGPFCQLILNDHFNVENVDRINDPILKKALEDSIGLDLKRIPQTKFTIIPECTISEIRQGIFDQVMMLFEPNGKGLSAIEIAENALDSLNDKIRVQRKHKLIEEVREQMKILVKNELKDYLEETAEGRFKPKSEYQDHYATREKIGSILKRWAGLSSIKETKLTDF